MADALNVLLIGAGGLVGRHLLRALPRGDVTPTFHGPPFDSGIQLDITDHAAVRRTCRTPSWTS